MIEKRERGRPKTIKKEKAGRFVMMMPESIHAKLRELADINKRSMAAQILIITDYYFDKIEKGEISASPIDV